MNRGRPKGYSPYIEISYEELGDWVGRKTKVVVCKKWLDALTGQDYITPIPSAPQAKVVDLQKEEIPKIEYKITKFD
jgi:hypothetical protein